MPGCSEQSRGWGGLAPPSRFTRPAGSLAWAWLSFLTPLPKSHHNVDQIVPVTGLLRTGCPPACFPGVCPIFSRGLVPSFPSFPGVGLPLAYNLSRDVLAASGTLWCKSGGIPEGKGESDGLEMTRGGGGFPTWRGQALMGSSWLTPSTPCPQEGQLGGLGTGRPPCASVCGLSPSVPSGTGPRVALTHPPATPTKGAGDAQRLLSPPQGACHPQRCLLPLRVPVTPKGACYSVGAGCPQRCL